jgi:dimethylargininase
MDPGRPTSASCCSSRTTTPITSDRSSSSDAPWASGNRIANAGGLLTRGPTALTRSISAAISRCELTYLGRVPIDIDIARRQHEAYERALSDLGCTVHRLAAGAGDDEMPDSVFIEDTAVVFDELAIMMRPGAESRRIETPAVAGALAHHRVLRHIEAPGTLDGGDVLVVSRSVFVGSSGRTNADGVDQIRRILTPFGYTVEAIAVRGCLHLKSAVSAIDGSTLLVNREWIDASRFAGFDLIDVDPSEPFAANVLRIGDTVVGPREFPRTCERLRHRGLHVRPVDAGELAKAEGGVTCCSLIIRE